MDRFRLRSLLLASSVVVVAACGPDGAECQRYGECPSGQLCQAGVCVSDNLPDAGPFVPRDGGGTPLPRDAGPRPDAGPAVDEAQVRTTFDVPWMQWDPRDPSRILFAEQQESGGIVTIDRVRALDTGSERIAVAPVYDLTTLASGSCRLDSIVYGVVPDETWFNCDIPPGLRIIFDENVANPGNVESDSAHVVHVVPGAGADFPRALVAARGGPLRSWQLRPSDGLNQPRASDAVSVSGVVALFDVEPRGVVGTHVLVHDGAASELVPLTRIPGSEEWNATPSLSRLALPAETHVAWVIAPISANGNAIAPNTPNLMTLEPSTGLARYWSYETAQPILPDTTFEPDSLHHAAKPAPNERLLFAPSPSGSYVFYTRAKADKIYRVPLVPGGDELVRQRLLDDTTREISSLLAVDDDTVWVSYSDENLIERLVVDERR